MVRRKNKKFSIAGFLGIKEGNQDMVHRRSYTNPYSDNLIHFFTKVAPKSPEQVQLFNEFAKTPLKRFIKANLSDKGDLLNFEIPDMDEYEKAKMEISKVKISEP